MPLWASPSSGSRFSSACLRRRPPTTSTCRIPAVLVCSHRVLVDGATNVLHPEQRGLLPALPQRMLLGPRGEVHARYCSFSSQWSKSPAAVHLARKPERFTHSAHLFSSASRPASSFGRTVSLAVRAQDVSSLPLPSPQGSVHTEVGLPALLGHDRNDGVARVDAPLALT